MTTTNEKLKSRLWSMLITKLPIDFDITRGDHELEASLLVDKVADSVEELYKDMVSKEEYEKTFEEVAKVYCELTNNKFSKANTDAIYILQDVQGRHEQELHDKNVNYLEIIERNYITKKEAYQKACDAIGCGHLSYTADKLREAFGINGKEVEK